MTGKSPRGLHVIGEYGEALMQEYFKSHGISFEREPNLPATSRKIDFAISTTDGPRVLVEVKTLWSPPTIGFSNVDFYLPIRRHIADASRQFSHLPDTLNVIAFAVFPGSLVDIHSPHVMLGAMYGDRCLSIPFDVKSGRGDARLGNWVFVPGRGAMIRKEGEGVIPRRSRIAALLSLHTNGFSWPDFGGREEISIAKYTKQLINQISVSAASGRRPYVTLWDNVGAKVKIPSDLFTGVMDMRWGIAGDNQLATFVGEKRVAKS